MNLQKFLFLLCAFLFLYGCTSAPQEEVSKKELLIYCGSTMAPAVRELADFFEQQEDCIVKFIVDGSESLYRSIQINQAGDLFLPGSESYIGKFQAEGMVVDTQPIGFNRAVLLVAKGNPKNISADMNNFINGQYRTILGASESGSIGRETRLILNSEGFYRKAVAQALFLATDSRKLVTAIEENRADLTINWHAATLSGKNRTLVDILPLDNIVAPPQVLILGLLKTSHHFELTRRFMQLAGSDQRQALLSRYGFGE